VNSKPQLGPDKQIKICFGAMANLAELYSTSGLNAAWSYAGSSITNPTVIQFAGIYQLIVNSSAGCKDTAVATLTIQPPVVADAGPDGNAEPNIPYQLHGTGGGSYEWSPAGLLDNSFIASPLATINSDTRFILTVKDEMGCKASDTMKLRVLNGPTFYVPTAFTPNGDGLNDIFRPTPVGIASIDFFRIFNRYGELVYETHDPGQGWDGTYRGVKQNAGNYVWWIRGTDRKGEAKLLKGNVVLIR
jgi:gliding motility-associated-like protein